MFPSIIIIARRTDSRNRKDGVGGEADVFPRLIHPSNRGKVGCQQRCELPSLRFGRFSEPSYARRIAAERRTVDGEGGEGRGGEKSIT